MAYRTFLAGFLAVMAISEVVSTQVIDREVSDLTQHRPAVAIVANPAPAAQLDSTSTIPFFIIESTQPEAQCITCGIPVVKRYEEDMQPSLPTKVSDVEQNLSSEQNMAGQLVQRSVALQKVSEQRRILITPQHHTHLARATSAAAPDKITEQPILTMFASKRLMPPSGYATVKEPGMMTSSMSPAQISASWSMVNAIISLAEAESSLAAELAKGLPRPTSAASHIASLPNACLTIGSFVAAIGSLVFAIYL